MGRGRRCPAGGAPLGRAPQRPPRACRRPWFRGEPGRCVERHDGAERPVPTARDPRGVGERGCRRRGRGRGGGARYGDVARRPDRGAGAARHVRPGPGRRPAAAAGFGEVEHRSHAGGRGCRRGHQDGSGDAARCRTAHAACGRAEQPRRLGFRRRGVGDGEGRVAGGGDAARWCVLLRDQRYERPCDPGAGASGDRGPGGRGAGFRRGGAVGAVRQVARRAAGPGGAAQGSRRAGRRPRGNSGRAGHHQDRLRTPRRRPGRGRHGLRRGPRHPGGQGHRGPPPRPRHGAARCQDRLRLRGAGRAVGGHGRAVVRAAARVRRGVRRRLRRRRPAARRPPGRRGARGLRRTLLGPRGPDPPDRLHPDRPLRRRGRAVPHPGGMGRAPGRRPRPLHR